MPTTPHRLAATVACCLVAFLFGACAEPAATGNEGPTTEPVPVRLYGADGTMQNSFAAELEDRSLVAGMKGTRPMTRLPSEFTRRLLKVDGSLQDFLYAGETYDAVVIAAIAAELAGTPDPAVVRRYINGVTTGGEECRSVAECLELAREGADLAYRGVSLTRGGFTERGEPAAASYETLHFGPDGVIDPRRSEYIGAGDLSRITSEEPPEPNPRTDLPPWEVEPLVFGGVLPETGDLSFAYPPIIAGARLAVSDINEAGGVFGVDVQWLDGDSGTDPEVARATIAAHVEAGVHVLIGPAASGVAQAVLPDAVEAGLIMFSPSNTAAALIDMEDDGYYFRTAPPDSLQGAALADMLLRDAAERIVIVARDDAYGAGLQRNAHESLLRFGVPASAVTLLTYEPPPDGGAGAASIAGVGQLADAVLAADPDALVIIGYSEAAELIQLLADRGLELSR